MKEGSNSDFQRVGRDLLLMGLISSHAGNLSLRRGARIWITRRGAELSHLTDDDIVETGLDGGGEEALASSELATHREIYRLTPARAVLHAHPVHAIALSLVQGEIVPIDVEGALVLGKVPVVTGGYRVGSGAVARSVAEGLKGHKVVVFQGHGSFSVGENLFEALHYITALEASAKIVTLYRLLGQREDK